MNDPVRPRGSRFACPQPSSPACSSQRFVSRPAARQPPAWRNRPRRWSSAPRHIHAIGSAQAFADISRPGGAFVEGELYVFCHSADGHVLANGGNPKLVGRNLLSLRDAEGRLPIVDVNRVALGEGQGWVDYLWPNPQTKRIQRKITNVVRIDDRTVCGSGFYQPDQP
jgi:cytochrome c